MENETLDSWDNYLSGNFLKAANVESEEDAYVCTDVESIDRDNKPQVRLHLQRKEIDWALDLNKTNSRKLLELGLMSPKEAIGKKIYFKKALATNPDTKKEVDTLRIYKID